MQRVFRYLLPLMLLVLLGVGEAKAQSAAGNAKNFPVAYGPTNAGRDFWLAFPANWDLPGSVSYYIRLYITSGVRTQVKVWCGPGIKKVIFTIPHDIVTVDITPIEAQMFVRADAPPVPPDRIFKRKAVHVKGEAPIVVYGMNRTTYTSDGILALPTNALGREYVVGSYGAVIGISQELPSQYMIVAPYNGTTVSIYHPHRTPNHAAGETFTIELDSGDVWSAMTVGYGGDMSGAVLRANKPIAVIGGQSCTYIPNLLNFCCCDHICEQMLPVQSWGKVYHGVPFQTRLRGDFYRVFAAQPNTKVYINGVEYATLTQAGGEEGTGWFEFRALGKGVQEFKADKPIFVTQYNTSQAYDNVASDPFYLALTPVEQFQTALTFCTPAADFPQNFFNLICDKEGYYDVEISPAGKNQWEPIWKISGAGVPKEFATEINGKKYVGVNIELRPGVYNMRGKTPFGGYLYGFSSYDSYGYPVSVATGDLTKPDKDAPSIRKTQTCDGTVEVTTSDLPEDDAIRTNLATIELDPDPANTDNYELTVTPFEAGVTKVTTYTLKVLDKNRGAKAVMIISDMAGNVTLDTVIYSPLNVTMLPSPQDYGKIRVGSKLTKMVTITNESNDPVELLEVLLKSKAEGFTILSPTGKVILGPKGSPTASVDVQIEYTAAIIKPGTLQVYTDSVGIRDNCGLRYMALVQAQVVKPMIRVTDHDFGPNRVSIESGPWQMEVRNTSTIEGSTLTVTASTGPLKLSTGGAKIFDVKSGTAIALPFTLEPNETRNLQITYTAPVIGPDNDAIRFMSDAMEASEDDSTGFLNGQGILGALFATSYDWGRNRQNYQYPKDDAVAVTNTGDASVRVVRAYVDPASPDAAAFIFDAGQINGMTIAPNASIPLDVTFAPTRTGQHEAKIIYEVDPAQTSEVSSTLRGYGTRPALETKDYTFGAMLVDADPTNTINYNTEVATTPADRITFSVPNLEEIDSVTVIRFDWVTDNFGGNNDFTYSESLPTPLVLKAGDRYIVEGEFKARLGGNRVARITAITNDNVDVTSNWNGIGTVENSAINLAATTLPPLCVDETGVITVTVTNVGQSDLTVSNMAMDGGPFVIVDPADPTAAFVLAPGATRDVLIQYTAQKNTQTANLVVTSDAINAQAGVSFQQISGTGLDENWNTKLTLKGTKDNGAIAELGKEVSAEISLDQTFRGMPTGMVMTNYRVVLNYDAKLLTPRLPAKIGGGTSGGATVQIDPAGTDLKNGRLTLVVNGFMVSNSSPLLTVPFAVLFSGDLVRNMAVTAVTSDANCLVVNGSNATINVDPICGLNLRMIELTAAPYTLDQNKPNPFNPVTKIRYSLGLDAPTTVQLFDAQGRMVQMLVNEHQQPGTYELTLDVTNLPSGNYYYTLVSGDFKETKMLTVTK